MRRLPAVLLAFLAAGPAPATVIEYQSRYLCQQGEPDHLLDVLALADGRAIVAGNRGLALLDAARLPRDGTRAYLARLRGLNARNVYAKPGTPYLFVNLNRGESGSSSGFAVVRLDGDALTHLATVDEPGVLYEKMHIAGDLLFVAAHSHGLRVFDISSPPAPRLVGRLDAGLDDAFAVFVDSGIAFVADGGGGLKLVDVTDPALPRLVDGETTTSAAGTSEDVVFRDGTVYVAAGGAGLAVYRGVDLGTRTLVAVGACAKDLAWAGEHLVVATIDGFSVVETGAGLAPRLLARETTARRDNGTLRLCGGVDGTEDGTVMAASWSFLDVYRLAEASSQPDVESDTQRIRFAPGGGERTVTLRSTGGGPLHVSGVTSTSPAFTASLPARVLLPGEEARFTIRYDGSPTRGSGVVHVRSDDPDENPLPIQVFGATGDLDPGEAVEDFTLPMLRYDRARRVWSEETFRLSDHRGRVVWLQVYASW